jgi:hypothetical protein
VTAGIAAAAESYDRRRLALRDALSVRGLPAHGTTGINLWVGVPDETRTVGALRDAGYAVAPGSLFRIGAPPGIRITISPLADADVRPLADAVAAAAHPQGATLESR